MTNPTEPTLTCSEVVERLAKELACHFDCTACVHGERHDCCCCCRTTTEIRTIATAILHSWRERRVQELEPIAKHPEPPRSADSAPSRTSTGSSTEIRCPFCGESDFDLLGLKVHLVRGFCEEFGKVAYDY